MTPQELKIVLQTLQDSREAHSAEKEKFVQETTQLQMSFDQLEIDLPVQKKLQNCINRSVNSFAKN